MDKIKITALIERSADGFYSISADSIVDDCFFTGYGSSADEAKEDFYLSIQEGLEYVKAKGKAVSVSPEDIEVTFHYELQTFFHDFDWINVSAFAKIAGINESKMRAYKAGICKASKKTLAKISKAAETLGARLHAASV